MKLWAMIPELILASLCLGLVPVAGFARGRRQLVPGIVALVGLAASMGLCGWMLTWQEPVLAFQGIYAIDGFANVFKLLILLGSFVSLLMVIAYFGQHSQVAHAPVAILFSTLGAVGLASSLDLGLIILFLQLMSFAGYVLVAMVRSDPMALEATIKYFIYGAVALAVMAYGLTFVYGLTGNLTLTDMGPALSGGDPVWVALALGLIVVGYGFEMAIVPFHVWSPDVFTGATAPIAGYLSVVPKVAGFAGLLRFILHALPSELVSWPIAIAALAVVTMTFGNLLALRQTRLKRLLAYSSIAQAGYVLMAVVVVSRTDDALAALAFYLMAYLLMNLGAFAVVAHLEQTAGTDTIDALRGLGFCAPVPAVVLAFSFLSLAGIPPLAGFAGKVFLLEAALEGGFLWLAVIAAINFAIGLYYYVAVVAETYVSTPVADIRLLRNRMFEAAYAITFVGTVLFGILPALLLQWTDLASRLP